MKKVFIWLSIVLISVSAYAQSYLGTLTRECLLRETAGPKAPMIKQLMAGTPVLIISLSEDNAFYNVVDIRTNEEGYVDKNDVKVGEKVENNEEMLRITGESVNYNPDLEIYNRTSDTLILKMNASVYAVSPGQHKTLTLLPGTFSYRAFVPGSIPIVGVIDIKSNQRYSWDFKFVSLSR